MLGDTNRQRRSYPTLVGREERVGYSFLPSPGAAKRCFARPPFTPAVFQTAERKKQRGQRTLKKRVPQHQTFPLHTPGSSEPLGSDMSKIHTTKTPHSAIHNGKTEGELSKDFHDEEHVTRVLFRNGPLLRPPEDSLQQRASHQVLAYVHFPNHNFMITTEKKREMLSKGSNST